MPKSDPKNTPIDADRLTREQLDARAEETARDIDKIKARWPGLKNLEKSERRRSPGRSLAVLATPLAALFTVLLKNPQLSRLFDVLGDQDEGEDPERFEVELLDLRLARARAEEKIADALHELGRNMDDDAIATAATVVIPGLRALELARTLSKGSAANRSLLAPALDAFREMTRRARKAREEGASKAEPKPVTP